MELYFFGRFQTKSDQAALFGELTLFFLHSRCADEAAFDFHAEQQHTVEFLENARPLLAQRPETTRTPQIA
jgi:quinol monooxygenase YgiN